MNLHFYHCNICGKVITILSDTGIPTSCCGQEMEELIPNHTDGASEKHVPVFSRDGDAVLVQVGSVPHPMKDDHYITWIGIRTANGFLFRELTPGTRPEIIFALPAEERIEAIYSYCNLHGLWCFEPAEGVN